VVKEGQDSYTLC
jgi:hypothetical protein